MLANGDRLHCSSDPINSLRISNSNLFQTNPSKKNSILNLFKSLAAKMLMVEEEVPDFECVTTKGKMTFHQYVAGS